MLFNNTCDIYGYIIVKKNHQEVREKTLKKQWVPCFISQSRWNIQIAGEASQLEQQASYTIALELCESVEVWDEIVSDGQTFLVQWVYKRQFANLHKWSLKISAKLV